MDPRDSNENKPTKRYGKRPVWQWIVIYLAVAIVVYGLVYLLFINKSGGTGY
jgi:hypothetical protein